MYGKKIISLALALCMVLPLGVSAEETGDFTEKVSQLPELSAAQKLESGERDALKLHVEEQFTTIHNYIDTDAMILRKGAVSAKAGEQLLTPINIREFASGKR